MELFDYQIKFEDDIRNAFASGYRTVLGVLPTGGGKTVCGSSMVSKTIANKRKDGKPKRVWVLAHRIELLRQFHGTLGKFGINAGFINPIYSPNYRALVQVGSIQTVIKRTDIFKGELAPDLIIVDEAHHSPSPTYKTVLAQFPEAKIIGLTATPIRTDGKGLGVNSGGVFEVMVLGPQIQDLIDRGRLVRPVLYYPPNAVNMDGVDIVRGDYDKTQSIERVDRPSITGDAIAHYKKYIPGLPAIVFCINVAHAEHVAAQFRAEGVKAWSVDGSMKDDERAAILGGLSNGAVEVVVSCDLVSEGTDIPAIAGAFLLRPTKSTSLYLQQVGRALRVIPGKERALIFDHVNNWFDHGLPEEIRHWSLDGETKSKKKSTGESPKKVRFCPMCYLVQPTHLKQCPECGHVHQTGNGRKIDEVEGDLVEMTEDKKAAMKYERQRKIDKAKTLEELEALAHEMGHHKGWAKYIWQYRQQKAAKKSEGLTEVKKKNGQQTLQFPD